MTILKNINASKVKNSIQLGISILATAMIGACGSPEYLSNYTIRLDQETVGFSSSLNSSVDPDRLWLVNDATGKIYSISVSNFEIEQEFVNPSCEFKVRNKCFQNTNIIASHSGNFLIVISDDEYLILRRDGSSDHNPVRLQGRIMQSAYTELPETNVPAGIDSDPGLAQDGILVLSDDLGSLAILRISATGEVLGDLVAGSIIPETGEQMRLAMVLPGTDTLLVQTSEGSLYRAAMSAALDQGDIEFVQVSLPLGMVIESTLPIRGEKSRIVVREKDKISILDVESMTIIEQVTLDPDLEFVNEQRGRWPHMTFISTTVTPIVHLYMVSPSGQIKSHKLVTVTDVPRQSYIDESGDKLTIVTDSTRFYEKSVYQIRLKDSLVIGRPKIKLGSNYAITEKYIFDVKPSVFGAMSRIEIEQPENEIQMEWFNLDEALKRDL